MGRSFPMPLFSATPFLVALFLAALTTTRACLTAAFLTAAFLIATERFVITFRDELFARDRVRTVAGVFRDFRRVAFFIVPLYF
jgi:hypothetical protein